MPTLHRLAAALLLALAVLMTGCEKSKVTADNFAKIKVGMSLAEVTNILGSTYEDQTPSAGLNASSVGISSSAATENVYVFTSKDVKILVIMKNGKVVQMTKPEG